MSERIKTNCPRDCYDGCGIVVEKRDDGSVRVLGDPDHPVSRGRLCSKCAIAYNGAWQDPKARLLSPLRRSGVKGAGEFEPISWETALEAIAERLTSIIDSDGGEAILHTHYSGTLSLIAYLFPNRFFRAIGASEVDPDTICNAAGHVAWHLQFGNSVMGFDPRTARDSQCLVLWGANPSHSAPHAHEHWLAETAAKVIVVDPVRTETAAAADLHLQVRPGTDAALAYGLLHLIRARQGFDDSFIEAHTIGADEISPFIDQHTPALTESITGVPAAQLEKAAEWYGAGPAMVWCGQALQRQTMGGNVMRAVGLLPALTGNVGRPGTGFYYLNYTPAFAGIDLDNLAGADIPNDTGKTVGHMEFAERLAVGHEFKALFVWNTNPLASAPNQQKLREACAREDLFTVVVDCFPTDTAAWADIVLPASSFLEFDDITFSYFHLHMGVQSAALPRVGESLPNQEIFRRLAGAMNIDDPLLYEQDSDLIERMMAQMDVGFTFDEFKTRGYFALGDEPMPMHAELTFDTPSGKIEIASDAAESMGLPRVPLPHADDSDPETFRLLTPASKWRLNDSYANDAHIHEQSGPARVLINDNDAARLGIADRAQIRLFNDTGEVRLQAAIDETVLPGVLISYKGRWPSVEDTGSNVNFVHTPRAADMGNSTSVHATRVAIEPI